MEKQDNKLKNSLFELNLISLSRAYRNLREPWAIHKLTISDKI